MFLPHFPVNLYTGFSFIERVELLLTGQAQQFIKQDIPDQIAYIFGINTEVGGVTPSGDAALFPGEDLLTFVTLKQQATDLWDNYRLSNLVFTSDSETKYQVCKIPGSIDMDRSFITNPTGITDRVFVLNLWYIPYGYLAELKERGLMVDSMGNLHKDGNYYSPE